MIKTEIISKLLSIINKYIVSLLSGLRKPDISEGT